MKGFAVLIRSLASRLRVLRPEDAYARYLRHAARAHADEAPMSRKAFFKAEQVRRWNGMRRCC